MGESRSRSVDSSKQTVSSNDKTKDPSSSEDPSPTSIRPGILTFTSVRIVDQDKVAETGDEEAQTSNSLGGANSKMQVSTWTVFAAVATTGTSCAIALRHLISLILLLKYLKQL